jgi:tRNA uridine 5-carboxymethylaminomethyl modification enzyme
VTVGGASATATNRGEPMRDYEIVVIGAGHAGCEAALAAARMGLRTAIVTLRRDRIAFMPCNPAIGGVGKGHLVREIDALGGEMGRAIDAAGIQFRILNRRKGPAVWSPRAQADKRLYSAVMAATLAACPNLDVLETSVEDILVEAHDGRPRVCGLRTGDGGEIGTRALIVTTGTFLAAEMHMGPDRVAGGRSGEPPAAGLSGALRRLGFTLGRLKTGTPPRLLRDSIEFSAFTPQPGDEPPRPFSHATERLVLEQVPCWIAHTSAAAHAVIRANLHRAPLYNGQIDSAGPRYCPSIEDKVVRFADRPTHHLFLEPEGRQSPEIYVNGLSTSLPRDVQRDVVARIPGLERAEIARYGYAVEYDFAPTEQSSDTLETRRIAALYFAGQINGTSGYEEAAAQGLLAGINAAAQLRGLPPLVLRRSEAYMGVLVDDLVRMQLTEPYRMFTSRAEFRLHLRMDNADERLMPYAERYGLLQDDVRQLQQRDAAERARLEAALEETAPAAAVSAASARGAAVAARGAVTFRQLLRSPGVTLVDLLEHIPAAQGASAAVLEKVEVATKYDGYVQRQARSVEAAARFEAQEIPADLAFDRIAGLSAESAAKLSRLRPRNVAQASRIDGVRASDLSLLLVHLKRRGARAGGQ